MLCAETIAALHPLRKQRHEAAQRLMRLELEVNPSRNVVHRASWAALAHKIAGKRMGVDQDHTEVPLDAPIDQRSRLGCEVTTFVGGAGTKQVSAYAVDSVAKVLPPEK